MSAPRIVVYILRCADGSLYTGAAKDLERRLAQHAAGIASRYTRSRLPVTLLWSRRERTWGRALQTELWIKQLPRRGKDAIVGGAPLRVRRAKPENQRRSAIGESQSRPAIGESRSRQAIGESRSRPAID